MKATITHLKAPWPAGAQVGHVVEFDGAIPAWAAGKCVPAADDAEVYAPAETPLPTVLADAAVIGEQAPAGNPLADAEAQAAAERAALKPKRAAKA